MENINKDKKQFIVFAICLVIYALLALVSYLFIPLEQLLPVQTMPSMITTLPRWLFGLANAVFILLLYGLLGFAGFWFSRQLGLPGMYRKEGGWRNWLVRPLLLGLAIGVFLVIADSIITSIGGVKNFPHPVFPFSIIASASAGIGEEILFRFFLMGLWAYLLNLLLRRWGATRTALWLGNVIAALAFSASHIPAAMILIGVSSPADIPVPVIVELFLLNSLVGLVAGEQYMRDGLIAAMGIHFWADIVWHVIWPLVR